MSHPMKTKQELSEPRQDLLRIMQEVHFGRIENLEIRDGLPVVDPPPDLIFTIKLGGRNGPPPEINLTEFALKAEVRELFDLLDDISNGTIRCVEIKHGLPFTMTVKRPARLRT